jgi:dolichol-phosphate mannosyltransferase
MTRSAIYVTTRSMKRPMSRWTLSRVVRRRSPLRSALFVARVTAGVIAVRRIAGAARSAPPVSPSSVDASISVVIPARDEATRIGPLLDLIVGAPGVNEVIVVDDQSADDTSSIARNAGATVVDGAPLADGWAGKAWALQQGIESASSEWVVTLDADTRPDQRIPAAVVARALADRLDFLTVGGRFECPTPATRLLHASMLTTLVYRFGPPGVTSKPDRAMANGQCMTVRRAEFLDAGGMAAVAGQVVEDIALARHLASQGWAVGFLDATDLLTVRMFESATDVWNGWGRSIALPGVEPLHRQLVDLAVVALAQALPLPRLLLRRGDVLDAVLAAVRLGTLVGTRTAYERVDVAYWASPLADVGSAFVIGRGIVRRGRQTWRGRTYG